MQNVVQFQCQILPDFHISNRMGCFPFWRKPENLPGRNPLGVWMLRTETISDLKVSWNKSLKLNCRWSCFFLEDCSAMRIKRHQQFDTIWRRDWVGLISKSGEMRSANPPTDDNRFSCLRNHERLFCRYFQIWRKHLSTSCHEHMKTLGDEVETNWAEIIHHHVFDLLTMKICKGSAALCARWDGPQPALCLCDCMLQQCYVDEPPYKDTSKNSAGRFGSFVSQLHAKQSFFVNHMFVLWAMQWWDVNLHFQPLDISRPISVLRSCNSEEIRDITQGEFSLSGDWSCPFRLVN